VSSAPSQQLGTARVGLSRAGIIVEGRLVPLYSGSVHYWRIERDVWKDALLETKRLGVRLIDTYVPWSVHETASGETDFGEKDPNLDVAAFLRLVHELDLLAIVRPGPHINGELTHFGIPERIIWDPACQARSPQGNPVMLPMVPVGFPVPSYASAAFFGEAEKWLVKAAAVLAPLRFPEGPIVLCQIDNEGTLYFRDGLYDQDYRPEAISLYRVFLRNKYGTEADLARAYGRRSDPFDRVVPPTIFDAETADELTFHLDWAEFQERLIAGSIARMKSAFVAAGMDEIPTFHNMTMGHEATPLSAAQLATAVDLVGLDYYHRATPAERISIERRTTELSMRGEGVDKPSFACEMGAGFPPYFFPIPEEVDNEFNVMTALAYGLRGFNIYMAVDRDRWIGAPIDRHGRPGPSAAFWGKLFRALEETRFHELFRRAPVRIVNTSLKRRLNRALHAFSPATPALFAVLGSGSHETCFEDDFGLGGRVASEVDAFIEAFEQALSARGVPFAHVDGETAGPSLSGARWIICPTAGGVELGLWTELQRRRQEGAWVTIGPRVPSRDGSLRPLAEPLDPTGFEQVPMSGPHPHVDGAAIDAQVDAAIRGLDLPVWTAGPKTVSVTVHEDAENRPRVLFIMNPTTVNEEATVQLRQRATLIDLFDGSRHECSEGGASVFVPARSVRMLRIDLT
jgi:beta-galactosidase